MTSKTQQGGNFLPVSSTYNEIDLRCHQAAGVLHDASGEYSDFRAWACDKLK